MDNRLPLSMHVEGGTTARDFDAGLYLDGAHIGFLLPTYVRAGAIIPTIELEQYVGERNRHGRLNPITLNVYPGGAGTYTMYLDDGVSRSSAPVLYDNFNEHLKRGGDSDAKGEYREVLVTQKYTGEASREIRVRRIHDGYRPPYEDYFFVAILHDPSESNAPSAIQFAGKPLAALTGGTPEERADRLGANRESAWYYNENLRISFVKVFDQPEEIVLNCLIR
jgi:alpha-glucosidase